MVSLPQFVFPLYSEKTQQEEVKDAISQILNHQKQTTYLLTHNSKTEIPPFQREKWGHTKQRTDQCKIKTQLRQQRQFLGRKYLFSFTV